MLYNFVRKTGTSFLKTYVKPTTHSTTSLPLPKFLSLLIRLFFLGLVLYHRRKIRDSQRVSTDTSPKGGVKVSCLDPIHSYPFLNLERGL